MYSLFTRDAVAIRCARWTIKDRILKASEGVKATHRYLESREATDMRLHLMHGVWAAFGIWTVLCVVRMDHGPFLWIRLC